MSIGSNMNDSINGNENILSNRDTYVNNFATDEKDYGIITEIFEFVFKKINDDESTETESSSVKDKLIRIKEKIELNFKNAKEQNEVKEYFTKLYTKIFFVEKAFQALNSEEQNDIHFYISRIYNSLKRSDDNKSSIQILNELSLSFIPESHSQNPTYNSIAQGIVLFFFDDCTIFEKTDKEPDSPNLFDGL